MLKRQLQVNEKTFINLICRQSANVEKAISDWVLASRTAARTLINAQCFRFMRSGELTNSSLLNKYKIPKIPTLDSIPMNTQNCNKDLQILKPQTLTAPQDSTRGWTSHPRCPGSTNASLHLTSLHRLQDLCTSTGGGPKVPTSNSQSRLESDCMHSFPKPVSYASSTS